MGKLKSMIGGSSVTWVSLLLFSNDRCIRFWQSAHDIRNLVTASLGRKEYVSAIW